MNPETRWTAPPGWYVGDGSYPNPRPPRIEPESPPTDWTQRNNAFTALVLATYAGHVIDQHIGRRVRRAARAARFPLICLGVIRH